VDKIEYMRSVRQEIAVYDKLLLDYLVPSKWIKGEIALDAAGNAVEGDSASACRWCLVGAVYHVAMDELQLHIILRLRKQLRAMLRKELPADVSAHSRLVTWNDRTTLERVRLLVEKARAEADMELRDADF
jgi:hypothetical protein